MNLLKWFTRPAKTTVKSNRAFLSLDALEARWVPAAGPKFSPVIDPPKVSHGAETAAAHANANALENAGANAAFNQVVTPPTPQQITINGLLRVGSLGSPPSDGDPAPWFDATVTVYKNGVAVTSTLVSTGGDGSFSITFDYDASAVYTIKAASNDDATAYSAEIPVTASQDGLTLTIYFNE